MGEGDWFGTLERAHRSVTIFGPSKYPQGPPGIGVLLRSSAVAVESVRLKPRCYRKEPSTKSTLNDGLPSRFHR
jgi:hypothetical protein